MSEGAAPEGRVSIETFEIIDGGRQISSRRRISERLAARQADVANAISEAARLIQESANAVPERRGWRVSGLEAKFGIKLSAGAGVILSSASTEASFEIVVKVTSD
ncbi:CU044_2847 family protein [Actinoplanes sp. NPDC026670]|uniref:CU044_2847 family protein n=1 Tax=Actinoplanes sp. NPDC026670 TaxID=3154700 RepID=UPI0033D438F7